MSKKNYKSQLSNLASYILYIDTCTALAQSVFNFKNLPDMIDISFLTNKLVKCGTIAWFKDEVLGLLALPYTVVSRDLYLRPTSIIVQGANGYRRTLSNKKDKIEFVIMYDNIQKKPLFPYISQYADRLALLQRTIDINVSQQKTPRIWQAPEEMITTLKGIVDNTDSFNEKIVGFNNFNVDEISCVLSPAPYVADKIREEFNNVWSEFLRLIGVASNNNQKRERLITDEIRFSQGGTIASRFARFETQSRAVDMINKFLLVDEDYKIELSFYDGLPTTLVESEVSEDDYTDIETTVDD